MQYKEYINKTTLVDAHMKRTQIYFLGLLDLSMSKIVWLYQKQHSILNFEFLYRLTLPV